MRDYFAWGGVEDGAPSGAHTLGVAVGYAGPENFPVSLLLASTVCNDPEASLYVEVGYARPALGVDWSAVAGALLQDGGFYGVGESVWINLGLSAARSIFQVGDTSIHAVGSVVRNAALAETYLVAGIGF